MRLLSLLLLMPTAWLIAAEPQYPLWDGHESVADYAKKVNLPPTKTLDLGNGVKMELVLVPAGKFVMGTEKPIVGQTIVCVSGGLLLLAAFLVLKARKGRKRTQLRLASAMVALLVGVGVWGGVRWYEDLTHENYPDEHPAHAVTLTNAFYMGKFAVTQDQYEQIAGTNPSEFKAKDNPVETVSWDNAETFCRKLSETTKRIVRLPSEAEWEYACRAGTSTTYYSGETEKDLERVAWYSANSNRTTHPVGQKQPNAFGLYDMHGNVWQWCEAWYGGDQVDECRLLRGGAWGDDPKLCRSAFRLGDRPGNGCSHYGFRVVLVPAAGTQ
jgi:formylglycine-generating enzyme required for sulfatase activity